MRVDGADALCGERSAGNWDVGFDCSFSWLSSSSSLESRNDGTEDGVAAFALGVVGEEEGCTISKVTFDVVCNRDGGGIALRSSIFLADVFIIKGEEESSFSDVFVVVDLSSIVSDIGGTLELRVPCLSSIYFSCNIAFSPTRT